MSNADLGLIQYLELAKISQARQQLAGRDRFLILAGVEACRAGWLDVAEACRQLVLQHNPHHLLNRWPTLPDAIRGEDFSSFLHQLERFCPGERAEALLNELNVSLVLEENVSAKDVAWKQLADDVWNPSADSLNDEAGPEATGKTA